MSTTKTLKRIEPLPLAYTLTLIYGICGIIRALGVVAATIGKSGAFLIGFVIGYPIGYAIAGFLVGIIFAWIYNFAAHYTGGIKVEIEVE